MNLGAAPGAAAAAEACWVGRPAGWVSAGALAVLGQGNQAGGVTWSSERSRGRESTDCPNFFLTTGSVFY